MDTIRLAIIDLYDGHPNQGMRCIREIAESFREELAYEVFDLRGAVDVPALSEFQLFIFSGGPGNPLEGDGVWDTALFDLMDAIWQHNQSDAEVKKYAFFICHSFQMAAHHFRLGTVAPRHSMSFGTFPVYPTDAALDDPILGSLPNPYYVADFRDYQLIQPDMNRFRELGAEILGLEKIRPHVPYERAVMAIRFSDEILGVQYHPEADAPGMLKHLREEPRLVEVINRHGKQKYARMIKDLSHPDKVQLTHETVLPGFIRLAIDSLQEQFVAV